MHFNPKNHHTIQIVAFFYHFSVKVKLKVTDPPPVQEYQHHNLNVQGHQEILLNCKHL